MKNTKPLPGLFLFFMFFILGCAQQPQMHADWWLTSGDGKTLLKKQDELVPTNQDSNSAAIIIDTASRFQTVDGFGYTLTGGSAQVINAMESSAKRELLQELFGQSGIKVS